MEFANSIFISYAHIDNETMIEGQVGWVSHLHRGLEVRLSQLRGRRPEIWRDSKGLQGNDDFSPEIVEQLPRVGVVVAVLTPRYLVSEWCTRERDVFVSHAKASQNWLIGNKARFFKVIKTPVPFQQHPESVRDLLGYEFYKIDQETQRPKELTPEAGLELERAYWSKIDDLAYDIAGMLDQLESMQPKKSSVTVPDITAESSKTEEVQNDKDKTVFLAETSYDLHDTRDALKRDLMQNGFQVLPMETPPLIVDKITEAVTRELSKSRLSVHMVGKNYGVVPEGTTSSVPVLQSGASVERAQSGKLQRMIWIPPGVEIDDERQQGFLEYLYNDDKVHIGTDMLETPLEEFKLSLYEKLTTPDEPEVESEAGDELIYIYIICEPRDLEAIAPLEDFLYNQGFEVITPVFDGDEAQVREDHLENLKTVDAVIFFYGAGNELWLRAKLRESQKIAGYGREKPMRAKAVYVAGPPNPRKDRYRTREAAVIKTTTGFDASLLAEFCNQLRGR